MRARRLIAGIGLVLLGTGSALLAERGYLALKAVVARRLIDRAFEAHLRDGGPHPPWSWADMHPIARLEVERLGVRRVVLSGASGSSMAFGVGHVDGTALPGRPGNCVLAGHRDTRLAFLQELRPGDRVRVETREGMGRYAVDRIEVVHAGALGVLEPTAGRRLTLVTCYPFEGLLRSPWRYVVVCRPIRDSAGRA